MISFIMTARNASSFINEAIEALRKSTYKDWELIAIDDNSADTTLSKMREISEKDLRIKVFENIGKGKIAGLNYGYTLVNGDIVKCIDADDILDVKFFNYLGEMSHHEATCHDAYVIKSNLQVIGNYSVDKCFLDKDFVYCLKNLKGIPKWAWSFTRNIGDKIFPMPEALPFEDVWFSLIIKKYAKQILHIDRRLYHYRQHNDQTYGGILSFDPEVLAFRAERMLKLIKVIKHEQTKRLVRDITDVGFFKCIQIFYTLLAEETVEFRDIITSGISRELKLKLIIFKKLNCLAPSVTRFKWWIDRIK